MAAVPPTRPGGLLPGLFEVFGPNPDPPQKCRLLTTKVSAGQSRRNLAKNCPRFRHSIAFLPASLRPMVEDIADRMQTPPDFPGVVSIATLAGLCGRRAAIQPKERDSSMGSGSESLGSHCRRSRNDEVSHGCGGHCGSESD